MNNNWWRRLLRKIAKLSSAIVDHLFWFVVVSLIAVLVHLVGVGLSRVCPSIDKTTLDVLDFFSLAIFVLAVYLGLTDLINNAHNKLKVPKKWAWFLVISIAIYWFVGRPFWHYYGLARKK